jgi:hypothetical protein
LRSADVVIAPLHKHMGLAVGLGLVLVRDELGPLHEVLDVAQSGAQSLTLLRIARDAALRADGRIFNRATVNADEPLEQWCAGHGLRLLTRATGVPFACFTTTGGAPVTDRLAPGGWRHNHAHNVARFSFYQRGSADDGAIDHTAELRAAVLAARELSDCR